MDYKKNQHSVYMLMYHAIFVVKYRRKVITPEIMGFIRELASRLIAGYGGRLTELNGEPDHIHILFELPPQAVPSKVVCSLKTQISKEVRAKFAGDVLPYLWGGKFWSESYFITTTGGASIETLERYVQSQGVEKPKRPYHKKQQAKR